jgi:hypothetical protein
MRTQTQELQGVPHVGDKIRLRRDALVEVASPRPGAPTTWRYLAAGSRGKLIGFRDRPSDPNESRAVIDIADTDRRLVVFVRETMVVSGD